MHRETLSAMVQGKEAIIFGTLLYVLYINIYVYIWQFRFSFEYYKIYDPPERTTFVLGGIVLVWIRAHDATPYQQFWIDRNSDKQPNANRTLKK